MENTITGTTESMILRTAPTARVRVLNKIANKKWQHETTVELAFDYEDGRKHYDIIGELLADADAQGRAENARRTALDANESEDF